MRYVPVLNDEGQTITVRNAAGQVGVRCVDTQTGATVTRPAAEFTGRPAVGAEVPTVAQDLGQDPGQDPQAVASDPVAEVELEPVAEVAPVPGAPTCHYCHQVILPAIGAGADLQAMTCDTCGTVYHAECWIANGGQCARFGCRGRRAEAEPAGQGAQERTGQAGPVVVDLPATEEEPAAPGGTTARQQGNPQAGNAPTGEVVPPEVAAARAELDRIAAEVARTRAEVALEQARAELTEQRVSLEREQREAAAEADRRARRASGRPQWAGKVIAGWFLGGGAAAVVEQVTGGGVPVIAGGEVLGVALAAALWLWELQRWQARREAQESEQRREAYLAAQEGQ